MGQSKFGKNSAVQQPPPICHKGPDELPFPPPPIYERTLQAYVYISASITPGFFLWSGLIIVLPTGIPGEWAGEASPIGNGGAVTIDSVPPFNVWTVQVFALRNGIPAQAVGFPNVQIPTFNPLNVPQLYQNNFTSNRIWQCTITE